MQEAWDDSEHVEVVTIPVWFSHMASVQAFIACDIEAIAGGFGIHWTGIGAEQIRAVCVLQRIARADWPDVLADVRYMAREVAIARNRDAERRAKGNG